MHARIGRKGRLAPHDGGVAVVVDGEGAGVRSFHRPFVQNTKKKNVEEVHVNAVRCWSSKNRIRS
jgi:hypothetical protein